MKRIVIVAHKFLTQPDDDLVTFLNRKRYKDVLHIRHDFNAMTTRYSWYTWYKNGNAYKEQRTQDFAKFPEPLIYLKELFYTVKWVLESGVSWDWYIGMDGLCVMFGWLLKVLRRANTLIYWVIDFVPSNRFPSWAKNLVYEKVNTFSYGKADQIWDLSPRMAEAREKFLRLKPVVSKNHRVVPYGVWIDRIKKYSYEECEKNTLVFMGILLPKQGAQLVIKAIPSILKQIPDFKFKIIGAGEYKDTLVKLASDARVSSQCVFLGKIEDPKDLEDEIAKSCLAIAPYIKKLDTWTYYADPGKVKTYLACGVPVLLTDIPWNAQDISNHGCGVIIKEDVDAIAKEVVNLMHKDINQQFRSNALRYSKSYDYNEIFKKLFSQQ